MGRDPLMTDDTIDSISTFLSEFISNYTDILDNDRVFDEWHTKIFDLLSPYSTGYKNYN